MPKHYRSCAGCINMKSLHTLISGLGELIIHVLAPGQSYVYRGAAGVAKYNHLASIIMEYTA
jgi:pyruvate/2-oxoacid:ferredoxin oxidoreductase beta subunit